MLTGDHDLDLMMTATFQGTSFRVRGRTRYLDEMSQIFICPIAECEYAMTALTVEAIDTVRRTHVRICHPELLADVVWREHFGPCCTS